VIKVGFMWRSSYLPHSQT